MGCNIHGFITQREKIDLFISAIAFLDKFIFAILFPLILGLGDRSGAGKVVRRKVNNDFSGVDGAVFVEL